MTFESQPGQLLSQVEAGIADLEQAVQSFELATTDIEQLMNDVERHTGLQSEASQIAQQALVRALHASYNAAQRVLAINTDADQSLDYAESIMLAQERADQKSLAALPPGSLILEGRYRVIQLLHQRPRVHLYLAMRLSDSPISQTNERPLVVIREIVLAGLTPRQRQQIEQAAFMEFVQPRHFGSPHLLGVGDRIRVEFARHYLVVQPRPARGRRPAFAATLTDFLAGQNQALGQQEMSTALHWGIQICLTVARLHHTDTILGEITPDMIVVTRAGRASWPPLLLPGWPPAPAFWPGVGLQEARNLYEQIFPTAEPGNSPLKSDQRPFAAPETLMGQRDERADVYALGALLYLLLTRHVPPSASQRRRAEQPQSSGTRTGFKNGLLRLLAAVPGTNQQFVLVPPHLLNEHISPLLEHIILRALALNPEQRFATVQDLAKALEGVKFKTDTSSASTLTAVPQTRVSQMRKLLEWLKKELNE